MTNEQNEPTTLADRLQNTEPGDEERPDWLEEDSTPTEATDSAVSGGIDWPEDSIERTVKQTAWQAWRAAWNQRGSTDSMDSLEERTARTAFNQWWEKDA